MQGQSNKVHNIERGVARHCQPKAFAVLLNKDENFNSPTALAEIAKAAKPRGTVGLYVSL